MISVIFVTPEVIFAILSVFVIISEGNCGLLGNFFTKRMPTLI